MWGWVTAVNTEHTTAAPSPAHPTLHSCATHQPSTHQLYSLWVPPSIPSTVCTIHQPSIDIFEAFDELLVLKPGGVCVYWGPLGHEGGALISYFSGIPGVASIRPRCALLRVGRWGLV